MTCEGDSPGDKPHIDASRELTCYEQQEALGTLRAGLILAGLSLQQLSDYALSIDGALNATTTAAVLDGTRKTNAHEHDVLAQAINDHLLVRGDDHPVRYSHELRDVGGN